MNISLLKEELIRDEGLRLKPYRCTAGKLTIGVGRNIEDVGISKDEALYLLDTDINRVTKELDHALAWWRGMDDARQRALLNMCFNLGLSRLLGFKNMLRALQSGDYETAAAEALDSKWARDVGSRAYRVAALIREG